MRDVVEVPVASDAGHGEGSEEWQTQKRTARVTGLWYLLLAISGLLGFLLIRPQIYVAGDPASTLANLVDDAGLARLGLVFELAIVVSQALAAVWFYRLFHRWNQTAAWALASFGMANAIAIMISATAMATALVVAGDFGLAPGGDAAATVQLLYELSGNCWVVGGLFFGLWLIPMGHIVITAGLMPRWLGRFLIVGGLGYVLSAFIQLGIPEAPASIADGLVVPASIGEFWMIGYLLLGGVRRPVSGSGDEVRV